MKQLKIDKHGDDIRREQIEREVRNLKRFNDRRHDHLIRLLATYTHQNKFHMIFPWADGNLKNFWSGATSDQTCHDHGVWLSAQILGLAKALQSIHLCPTDGLNTQGLTAEEYNKRHGRHGDLKPENILWFRYHETALQEQSQDVLQIADFGFADFHGPDSKSNVRLSKVPGFTDSYKAPEFEVGKHVSPQYDIWSFGCILTQFAMWWMWGWQGVENFSKARSKETDPITQIGADTFYSVQYGFKNARTLVSLKDSVVEVSFDLASLIFHKLTSIRNCN